MPLYKILSENTELQPFRASEFRSKYQEKDLEDWIEQNPEVLVGDEPLLIIGRQVSTSVGVIDLLALDSNGSGIIIELKRAPSQREAVGQALEYASWLSSLDTSELADIAETYLRGLGQQIGLEEVWQDTFGSKIDDASFNSHQRIFIVVEGESDRIASLVRFLRSSDVDISLLSYNYYRTETGEEILLLESQVGESEPSSQQEAKPSEARLKEQWNEQVVHAYEAFKEALLSGGLYSRPKKSGMSFYAQTEGGSTFVCFFNSGDSEASVWMRTDSLTSLIDFASASEAIKKEAPSGAQINHTTTWFKVRFSASVDNAMSIARLVLEEVVARLVNITSTDT